LTFAEDSGNETQTDDLDLSAFALTVNQNPR
jgi:hypothetical protein